MTTPRLISDGSTVPDDDLIERAKAGDDDAWRELYESLTGRLLVWLRTRPSGDAAAMPEDIVAEAWLVAATSIADFSGNRDAFAGWLFSITRNLATNARRRSLRRATQPRSLVAHDEPAADHNPATVVAGDDWTRRALATLSPREGDVLACMEVVGLDVAQTALALDLSPVAVRVARHRGLVRLRRTYPELVGAERSTVQA